MAPISSGYTVPKLHPVFKYPYATLEKMWGSSQGHHDLGYVSRQSNRNPACHDQTMVLVQDNNTPVHL